MSRYILLDRTKLKVKPISERESKSDLSIIHDFDSEESPKIGELELKLIEDLVTEIKTAKSNKRPVILAYGAHLFRNGCSPAVIKLMQEGYIQQLLTNGAGVIHEFEIAYIGKTAEDVEKYIREGQFGIWDETGYYINKALILGAEENKGYGEAIGEMISTERLGNEKINFPNKRFSISANAYDLGIPFSVCVGIGQDIIYTHPVCDGAAIGKTSYTDFLIFANTISNLEGGVLISVGSAVMAPMVVEKSIAMAKNLAIQENRKFNDYRIFIVDLQLGSWDWSKGEPPKGTAAYGSRFKSFARMGGRFSYLQMHNRVFMHTLYKALK